MKPAKQRPGTLKEFSLMPSSNLDPGTIAAIELKSLAKAPQKLIRVSAVSIQFNNPR